jgi:hypothetical protein
MSVALLLIAGVILVSNWRAGWFAVAATCILAVPAVILLLSRSRFAAVLLAVAAVGLATWVLIMNRTIGIWPLLIWFGVLGITQRAFRATFRLHELSKQQVANDDGA